MHRVLMKDEKSDPYAQFIVYYGLIGIISFVTALINGGFQYKLEINQFLLLLPLTILLIIGPLLLFKSFQTVGASEGSIIQTSQKIWTITAAILFLNEALTFNSVLATILIILGILITMWEGKRIKLTEGILIALLSSVIYSISDIMSYYLAKGINPASLIVYISIIPVLLLIILRPKSLNKVEYYANKKRAAIVLISAFISTFGTIFSFLAYRYGGSVTQITLLLSLTTILSVILAIVFLSERKNIPQKLIGSLLVVIGAILII